MRKFTKPEENIIKKMVAAKEIKELFLAKLIDENSPAIALEWSIDPANFTIFYRSSVGTLDKIFDQVQEIIFLLKTLEDEKFIYLHHCPDLNPDNRLYNRKKYIRDDIGKYYFKEDNGAKGEVVDWMKLKVNTNFGNYVQHYANGIFYVSNALRDLVDNDFKTPEQRRFKKEMKKAKKQVKYSRWAFYGSIAAFLSSLIFGMIQMCSETKIDQSQLNQIKQTIEQKTLPDVIKTHITNDTLTTKVVEMPKVKSNK